MRLNILRKDPEEDPQVGVVIISATCCVPTMAPFDEQARQVIDQAVVETGVAAQVKIMPATTAFFGGAPKTVMARLMTDFQSGKLSVPAVLIDGKAVSFGVPALEEIKAALLQSQEARSRKKERTIG